MESNTCLIPQIPVCTLYSICMHGYSGFRTSLESTQNISNGRLMKLFHRTRSVELQIMFDLNVLNVMSHMLTHFDDENIHKTLQAPFCWANSWTSSASHWFGTRRIAVLNNDLLSKITDECKPSKMSCTIPHKIIHRLTLNLFKVKCK